MFSPDLTGMLGFWEEYHRLECLSYCILLEGRMLSVGLGTDGINHTYFVLVVFARFLHYRSIIIHFPYSVL